MWNRQLQIIGLQIGNLNSYFVLLIYSRKQFEIANFAR